MQASVSTAGYHSTVAFRPVGEFKAPIQTVHGYTEPQLKPRQDAAVILVTSVVTSWLQRPISKLHAFYFLSDVPGASNQPHTLEKRVHFFRTLFNIPWLSGQPIIWNTSRYVFLLTLFVWLRHLLSDRNNTAVGFTAGALTGVVYTLMRHPYDVLHATAAGASGPVAFTGAMDVVKRAMRENPRILLGIYRGLAPAASGRALLYCAKFGVYNALRYDGVYHGTWALFLYCHFGACLGRVLQYPFLSARHQLHMRNQQTRGRPLTFRSYIMEVRARHGITKIYDGFFASRPFLNAVPSALLLTLYDVCTRRLTEHLHPDLRKLHAKVDQPLCSTRTEPYASRLPVYEFGKR
ncbi:hypothetical protein ERJ75_001243800 [Trypanosoma vivax]|uniref:Mitochondrial carrier protein n=1 Tax=Trypanosoma vivax (strain Y486) TaxID=1055687 RepID=G0TWH5_TRYVY|nr:hypothetical protein TRVL_01719 [Trypanosoma vivax]KAH8609067.1 hypothetical protein ERJ75_001243800 [Trypanosoma vivax]CCC48313.1 conserved hypothetical protein [Trypanosoma vivax Y486]